MVAYNFQKQFAEPIRLGAKTHTIRKNSRRRHARPGEKLQLYTGMRTRNCEKIIDDPTCQHSLAIAIDVGPIVIDGIVIEFGGATVQLDDLSLFATDDGFPDLLAFYQFWLDFHGEGTFNGRLISWGDFSPHRYDGRALS